MMITSKLPSSLATEVTVVHVDDNTLTSYLQSSQDLFLQQSADTTAIVNNTTPTSSSLPTTNTRKVPLWMDIAKLLDRLTLDYKRSISSNGNVTVTEEALRQLLAHWIDLLKHEEPRLRFKVLHGLQENWSREQTLRPTTLGTVHLVEMDDTTGWRCLESYIHAFHNLLLGASRHLATVDKLFPHLFNLQLTNYEFLPAKECILFALVHHTNRHIREKMFSFLFDLFNDAPSQFLDVFAKLNVTGAVLDLVPSGLEDDWSQIRYTASKALDALLTGIPSAPSSCISVVEIMDKHGQYLIPRLCMNRFHPAKSLQTISLDVWKRHLGPNALGRHQLAVHAHTVLTYYMDMAKSRNHMISEAALQAIAEFATKLDSGLIEHHYDALFATLAECLEDERWPVKDAACLCSGVLWHYCKKDFSALFPKFCSLYAMLLKDCMWSVRQNAAIAIGECCQSSFTSISSAAANFGVTYIGNNLLQCWLDEIVPTDQAVVVPESTLAATTNAGRGVISSFLPKAMVEQAEAKKNPSFAVQDASNTALSSSPISSMPVVNMRKGWGCCIDCVDQRQTQSWEISQGALYVIRELSVNYQQSLPLRALTFAIPASSRVELGSSLDMVITLLQDTNYKSFDKLHADIYSEIPTILSSLILVATQEDERQKVSNFMEALMSIISRDDALQIEKSQPVKSNVGGNRPGRPGRSVNENRRMAALKCKDCLIQGNYPVINEQILKST